VIVVGAGGLMRRGTANDLATPTSAGGSEGLRLSTYECEGDEDGVMSNVGDKESGIGLECCSRYGRIMSGLVRVGEDWRNVVGL
jgi:hypothetical protein